MAEAGADKSVIRELAKRRVFIFFSVLIVAVLGNTLMEESDMFLHALDDYVLVGIAIIVLILIAAWRKKSSLSELKRQHNIILILFIIALAFQIYAFPQEIGDPVDFGNEIPSLILLILVFINRFV